MDIRRVLDTFLHIVRDSSDYFISGSLSFLPLLPRYREPKHDVDVGISIDLFRHRQAEFEAAGDLHVLRLSGVAIADASPVARLPTPRTKFVHINTTDGLIDVAQYRLREDSIELFLGVGLTLRIPKSILERVQILEWEGLSYQAGPPELAILPKVLWYLGWKEAGGEPTSDEQKHLVDLRNGASLVDWEFTESLLAATSVCWLGRPFPPFLDRTLNPLRRLDLARIRLELENLAA